MDVNGVDASTKNLGLDMVDWKSTEDINSSINQVLEAINKIQDFISELGNNLEVMATRENFTKNIINTLKEGAEKLVLAAQSAQSILRLF